MKRHKVQPKNKLTKIIERKAKLKLHAKKEHNNIWRMSSFFGLVGFSIVLPLAALIWLGTYLDKSFPVGFSWTMMGIILGLVLGGINAWRWIQKEEDVIEKDSK